MNLSRIPLAEKFGLWLIGLMWVLPFLNPRHQLPIPSFYSELTAFALGLLALGVLWQMEVWQDFQLPRITLLPFGLIVLILLQMALGMVVFPQMALIGMQYLLWACLLMVLGQRLRRVLGWERLAATLAWCLMVGGLLNVATATLQYTGVKSLWLFPKLSAQSFGNLGQPNHFADYMALAIGSLVYLFARHRLSGLWFTTLATAFLSMLALSGSRSSWLYLAAFFLLAWVMLKTADEPRGAQENSKDSILSREPRTGAAFNPTTATPQLNAFPRLKLRARPSDEKQRLMLACLVLLPAFALVQAGLHWLLPFLGSEPHLLPTEHFFQQVSGASVRWQIWQDALQMFLTHPWLGVGYGQFQWHSFLLAGTDAASEFSRPSEHAHNLPLQLLAELGLSAGLLLLTCVWLWIRSACKETFTLENWWMWALLAVLGIHSLLEYPLWYSFFLGIAAMLLGAGETRMLRADFSRIGRPALAALLGLGLYGAFGMAQAYATLENWTMRAIRHQIKDSDLPRFKQELSQLHRQSMLTPYVELIYALSLTPNRELLDEKLTLSEDALRFKPVSELAYRYAELLALKGKPEAARQQLKLARKVYPAGYAQYQKTLQELGPIRMDQANKSPTAP